MIDTVYKQHRIRETLSGEILILREGYLISHAEDLDDAKATIDAIDNYSGPRDVVSGRASTLDYPKDEDR